MGRGAAGTAYVAGKSLGHSLGLKKLADFLELCKTLKVGIIEVPLLSDTRIRVDVYRVRPVLRNENGGAPFCHFEGA